MYTFEFKKEGLSFSGMIKSIDWNKNIALVEIPDDGKHFWEENFGSNGKNEEVSLDSLLDETEKVSSYTNKELRSMLKKVY